MTTANETQLLHIGLHAASQPDKAAALMADTGEALTYRQLNERSRKVATYLRRQGLKSGDHVAVLMRSCLDYFVATWAARRSELHFTPINWHLTPDEIAYIIEDCGARAVFVTETEQPTLDGVLSKLPKVSTLITTGRAQGSFVSLDDIYAAESLDTPLEEREGQIMFYSSGTTGRPKGIKRPVDGVPFGTTVLADKLAGAVYGFEIHDVQLAVAPLYHAAPLSWAMSAQRTGSTVVVMPRFDPSEVLRLIEHHRVTHIQFVPTMFSRLLNLSDAERRQRDLSSLKCIVHAAAPCPVDVKRRMIEWWGPIISEYYAGSEGNGYCMVSAKEWLANPGTVGRPLFGQVHILDGEENEIPPGQVGQIYFGGGARFEYHGDSEKTRNAYSKQGYSTLGDFGYLDADGYIADRRTDLILSGGVNVYPRETEEVLMLHPAVLDVGVIGVPNPDLGQEVMAVIELKPGQTASPALADELMQFCRSKIAHFKCPRRIEFAALPRTETGKLLRRKLKERYSGVADMARQT